MLPQRHRYTGVLPFATVDEVREQVKRVIRELAPDGRDIFSA